MSAWRTKPHPQGHVASALTLAYTGRDATVAFHAESTGIGPRCCLIGC